MKALGFKGKEARVLDFYNGEDLGTTSGALTMDVTPHDFRMLRLRERWIVDTKFPRSYGATANVKKLP